MFNPPGHSHHISQASTVGSLRQYPTNGHGINRSTPIIGDELERLRSNQFRLNSLVQELRLEISYYQGETKRLEWEKNVLKCDVDRLTSLFAGWLEELQTKKANSNIPESLKHSIDREGNSIGRRNIIADPQYLRALVKYPVKHISDILQLSDSVYLLTTCQPPYFVEV
jgi:hypothetical protein